MECPVCGSKAVTAKTSIPNLVEMARNGIDPYDLIRGDQAQAECRARGAVFVPAPEEKP
ncbi:MAG: hypothetical protein V1816_02135 [Pseudomonadota bacterium]